MSNQYQGQGWNQQPPPGQQYQGQGWNQQPPSNEQYQAQPNQWGPPYGGGPPQNQYPPPPQQQQQQGYNPAPPEQYNTQWGPYPQPPTQQVPQQGWGSQLSAPPGQMGPSPGQWGPPAQQYGSPAQQPSYGSPYNAAPAQQPYGTPQTQQFGPPQGQYGAPTQPSLGYGLQQTANIDVSQDVQALRRAMKGFGTDEKALIEILAKKDPIQINTIRTQYQQRLTRDLVKDLESEASGFFKEGLVQIARGPLANDCYALKSAMKGIGTKEAALDDVLIGRSNADINAIKTQYQAMFVRSLEADLRSDLSGETENMYMMIIAARRAEDFVPVVPQEIEHHVTELQGAMANIITKNPRRVCEILLHRNDEQLRVICQAYKRRFPVGLEGEIKSKLSGHMKDALLLLLARAKDRATAEAVQLEDAMKGVGTKDMLLVQRLVRCHWDQRFMSQVKTAYKREYRKDLEEKIKAETSGHYRNLMVACVK